MEIVPLVRGDEQLVKWITIPEQKDLIMRIGQTKLPMKVTIDVPKNAALKNYRGSIYITLSAMKEDTSLGGGEVGIALGANISIDITVVGDKVVDYWIKSISNDPIQEGNPLSLKVEVENLGNTEVREIEGQIDIYNNPQKENLDSFPLAPLDKPLLPDDTRISRITFEDIMLDAGEYILVAKAFKDEKVVYENRMVQKIIATVVPVVTSEGDLGNKPSLPGAAKETDAEIDKETDVVPPVIQVPIADIRPVAPAPDLSSAFLIFGLAGLGFGMIALIGVIVVMIFIVKNQRRPEPVQAPPVQAPPVQAPPVAKVVDGSLDEKK